MTNESEEIRYRASLAGSGDPWPALSRDRLGLLCLLQDGAALADILRNGSVGLDQHGIDEAVAELSRFGLLTETEHGPRPLFLIVPHEETRRVVAAASATGTRLAERICDRWPSLEAGFQQIPISGEHSLHDLSFFLIGARMLDIDLLTLLVQDGRLLTPAPSRPSSDVPNARYFFYAIEGTYADMGAYGLDSHDLPWPNWQIGTFARNIIDGEANPRRESFDREKAAAIEQMAPAASDDLAAHLGIPCLDKATMLAWDTLHASLVRDLFGIYEAEADAITALSGVRAAHRFPQVLGEFVCWYHHVAYAAAIEALIRDGLIVPPEGECIAAVWYCLNPVEGVMIE
ncbi:hypothetical protein ACFLTM_03290 [Candidatus Bipolaricaulota bacterium]